MRKCDYCGADIPDDELKCPVCGHEVQLVPDYEPLENLSLGESIDNDDPYAGESERDLYAKEDTYYEGNHRSHQERRDYHLDDPRVRELAIQKRKKKIILSAVLAAIGVVTVTGLIFAANSFGKKDSTEAVTAASSSAQQEPGPDKLYEEAQGFYQSKDYTKALDKINEYLKELPDDEKGSLLKARILIDSGSDVKGATLLEQIIDKNASCQEAYEILLPYWLNHKYYSKINKLMASAADESIRSKFADYIAEPPEISPASGEVEEPFEVEIKAKGEGSIYYTDDGTQPSASSDKYTGPIKIEEEGTRKIRAVFVNAKGVQSEIASAIYQVQVSPEAPVIKTKSGTYETGGAITAITVEVPDGYSCYYAFDKEPTKESNLYTGPVAMVLGTHTFKAALLKNGSDELGPVSSVTITYKETSQKPELKESQALNSNSKIDAVDDGDKGSDKVEDQDAAAQAAETAAEDAAVKAVLSVWNPYSQSLVPGATKEMYNTASRQVSGLKDGTLKSELQSYLDAASAAFSSQESSNTTYGSDGQKGTSGTNGASGTSSTAGETGTTENSTSEGNSTAASTAEDSGS
ncbi:MAG: chitobiase/beta-hexosaminidase C-terminal domain-containing protein [Eubacterium sp.]|nr:chitobiase/beta-hexosaminidase C-terminal domain-containing protein [Eubacterium sp.]